LQQLGDDEAIDRVGVLAHLPGTVEAISPSLFAT
jgi:hypothetical protein